MLIAAAGAVELTPIVDGILNDVLDLHAALSGPCAAGRPVEGGRN